MLTCCSERRNSSACVCVVGLRSKIDRECGTGFHTCNHVVSTWFWAAVVSQLNHRRSWQPLIKPPHTKTLTNSTRGAPTLIDYWSVDWPGVQLPFKLGNGRNTTDVWSVFTTTTTTTCTWLRSVTDGQELISLEQDKHLNMNFSVRKNLHNWMQPKTSLLFVSAGTAICFHV